MKLKKQEARNLATYSAKWLWPGYAFGHVGPSTVTPPDWWREQNEYLKQKQADAEAQAHKPR